MGTDLRGSRWTAAWLRERRRCPANASEPPVSFEEPDLDVRLWTAQIGGTPRTVEAGCTRDELRYLYTPKVLPGGRLGYVIERSNDPPVLFSAGAPLEALRRYDVRTRTYQEAGLEQPSIAAAADGARSVRVEIERRNELYRVVEEPTRPYAPAAALRRR